MSAARPEIGAWYQTSDGDYLEVVAYDAEDGTIEIQFYDGAVAEYDEDHWEELQLTNAEPPEDWSGSLDVTKDDYGVDLDLPTREVRGNPLDLLDEQETDLD
jgi:hypothetical protein